MWLVNWLGMNDSVRRSRVLKWHVSDELWGRLERFFVDPPRRSRFPGRRRYSPRQCLEGILYVLFTGTPWEEIPYRELGLPSGVTCWRRLEEWSSRNCFREAIDVLQKELASAGKLDWSRVIVDASMVDAKKGVKRSRARSVARREVVST